MSPPAGNDPARERRIGDFRLVRELGRGGMGVVYEAEQTSLHRRVALKLLASGLTLDERALQRFQREAELAARLHHPGIVAVHSVGQIDDTHYIAMDLIEGLPLDALLARLREARESGKPASVPIEGWERPGVQNGVKLAIQVAEALEHAHQQGVVHRDVKPSNILVCFDGRAVLTDFGIATGVGMSGLTKTGEFAGSVHYVSPEQAMVRRVPVDHRSDVFSLGATLYEVLTLQRAFEGESDQEVLTKILTRDPLSPSKLDPAIPRDVSTIVFKALEKDPGRRYASAQELAEDLRAFLEYRPIQARPTATAVRAVRWARREPAKAAVIGLLLLGLPVTGFLVQRVWSQGTVLAEAELERELEGAFVQLAEGDAPGAAVVFARVLAARPASPEALAGLAMSRLWQGDGQAALAELDAHASLAHPALDWIRADALAERDPAAAAQGGKALPEPRDDLTLYVAGYRALRKAVGTPGWSLAGLTSVVSAPRGPIGALPPAAELFPAFASDVKVQQKLRSAVDLFSRAIALSRSPRALYHHARIFAAVRTGDESAARQSADALERFWPDSAPSLSWIGVARIAYDLSAAVETFARTLEKDPERPLVRFYLGIALLRRGDLAGAVAALRKETELSPEHADLRNSLGIALHRSGEFVAAIAEYRRALAIDSRFAAAQANLARAQLDVGNVEAAIGACRDALAIDASFPPARFILASAYYRANKFKESIEEWERYLAEHPDDADAHGNLGAVLLATEQLAGAVTEQERAVALGPNEARHQRNLGTALLISGERERARERLERALALDPGLRDAHYWLATTLGALGRLAEQRQALERWTRVLPEDANAWNDLAWFCVDPEGKPEQQDHPTALAASGKAIALPGGDTGAVLDTRAWALLRNGRAREALETGQQALERISKDSTAAPGDRAAVAAHVEVFRAAAAAEAAAPK